MRKILIISILLTLLVTACNANSTVEAVPTIALPDQPVAADTTSTAPQASTLVIASGNVVARVQAHLSFAGSGTISAVNVTEGDTVQAGNVLVELDSNLLRIQLERAENDLAELTSPMAIAQAESELATAQDELEDHQDKVDGLTFPRASDERIENNQAEIDLAKKQVALASDAYRLVARLEDGNYRKAEAILNLTNAQMRLDSLQATQNWYVGRPTAIEEAIIRSDYDVAKNRVAEAEWYLAELKGESVPDEATGARLNNLRATKLSIRSLTEQIANNQIISPFDGTIARVDAVVGELALPGQSIIFLVDTKNLEVETTDLSEKDVPKVFVGQKTLVQVDALGVSVDGIVILIDPIADTLGGDVVYLTRVQLIDPPADLRSGMSVDVEYLSE